jgi:hypothetical protein
MINIAKAEFCVASGVVKAVVEVANVVVEVANAVVEVANVVVEVPVTVVPASAVTSCDPSMN